METAADAERTSPPACPQALELRCQFEAAVAFADYCAFLTSGGAGDRASRLVDAAEALLAETLQALGHTAAADHRSVDGFEQRAG
jgi:hypothetical protein